METGEEKNNDILKLFENKYGKLSSIEKKFLYKTQCGKIFDFEKNNNIRTKLIEELYLFENGKFIPPRGLRIKNTKIEGKLDLSSIISAKPLSFVNCQFDDDIVLENASFLHISLKGSKIKKLFGKGLHLKGNLDLNNNFEADGPIELLHAHIGDNLNCRNGTFQKIEADGIRVEGSIFLENSTFHEDLELNGINLLGDIDCNKGEFQSVMIDRAKINGAIFLKNNFSIKKVLSIRSSNIKTKIDCTEGNIGSTNDNNTSFTMDGTHVNGIFEIKNVKIHGKVSLSGAKVDYLIDDIDTWPKENIQLDGFTYQYIQNDVSNSKRIEWLKKQVKEDLIKDFKSQPWEQLAKVLREMGHRKEAKKVLIKKHRINNNSIYLKKRQKSINWFFDKLMCYGYRPWRTLYYALFFIFIGWGIFWYAGINGDMTPLRELYYLVGIDLEGRNREEYSKDINTKIREEYTKCLLSNWYEELPYYNKYDTYKVGKIKIIISKSCEIPSYPEYNSLIYSFGLFLPIVDLYQEEYWQPVGTGDIFSWRGFLWGYHRFHILMGWFLTTFFVIGLTGLVLKE